MGFSGRAARRGAGRTTIVLALPALLAAGLSAPGAPAAAGTPGPPNRAGDPAVTPGDRPLDRPVRGRRALDELGERLPEVARLNGLSRRRLTTLLEEDSSAWVDPAGRVFFQDPVRQPAADAPGEAAEESAPAPAQASPGAPLAQTFQLHSRPGASRTIFLDVDGATVSGTAWNSAFGIGSSHPAWDPSGNGPSFDDTERTKVQTVWRMVAEDFAAFDVDVTTEDPGPDGLSPRTDSSDTTYGAHVLITPSSDAAGKVCNSQCGGVAYLSVFDEVAGSRSRQPAWVFTGGAGSSAKGIAEAASHEVGHQLGLDHDGVTGGSPYYGGHGAWGPIMGSSYRRPISQWSRGAYAGADNQQDDLAVIARTIPQVPDEAGAGLGEAAPMPDGAARITSSDDVDTWALGECSGVVTATATTASDGPDLDLQLSLRDETGAVLATADPASARVSSSAASGMDATLTAEVSDGVHYLSVDGVGQGSWSTGYDDYASIGSYGLSATGCDGESADGAPSAPQDVTATAAEAAPEVTVSWTAPADAGAGGITGYTLTRSGSATPVTVAPDARRHTLTGLEPDTEYTVTLRAQNASGVGRSAVVTTTTAASPVRSPGAPQAFTARWDATEQRVRLAWLPPRDDGGSPVLGYQFRVNGHVSTVHSGARSASGSSWDPGRYDIEIRATNSLGAGDPATATVTVPSPLSTSTRLARSVADQTVSLRAVVSLPDGDTDGGGPPSGDVTFTENGAWAGRATLVPLDGDRAVARLVLEDVLPGDHAYRGDFTPDTPRLAPSARTGRSITVGRIASTTSAEVPRRRPAGTRPLVGLRVAGGAREPTGAVRVVVRALRGRTPYRATTLWLVDGAAAYRLPRLRPGRVRVTARYRGSGVHLASDAGRTIRVVRR